MKEFTIEITRVHTVVEKAMITVTAEDSGEARRVCYRRAAEEGAAWREESKVFVMQMTEIVNWRETRSIPQVLITKLRNRMHVNETRAIEALNNTRGDPIAFIGFEFSAYDRWLERAVEHIRRQGLCAAAAPPKELRVIDLLSHWRSEPTTSMEEAMIIMRTRAMEAQAAGQEPRVVIASRKKDDPRFCVNELTNYALYFSWGDGRAVTWDPE